MKTDINYSGSDQYTADQLAAPGTQPIERPEPIVKVDDLAYIVFNKSNLQRQKQFLLDFGMVVAEERAEALYMRGTGPLPYFYVAYDYVRQKQRDAGARRGFVGAGFSVKSEAQLQALSHATDTPIDAVDGPGGGQRVRLRDPDGFIVDVVWGRQPVERLDTRQDLPATNTQFEKARVNEPVRTPLQPSALERLGHYVLSVTDFKRSMDWYMRHVGVIPTDVQCLEDGTPALSFNRLNRGEKPADHHSVVIAQNVRAQYMHSAYETLDLDSIGQGQQYLKWRGWTHFWGIGRHILGSQIFDYWLDPEGDELEHYADGDVFDESYETRYHLFDRGGLWAWGHDVPDAVRPKMTPGQLWSAISAIRSQKVSKELLAMTKNALSRRPRPWLK